MLRTASEWVALYGDKLIGLHYIDDDGDLGTVVFVAGNDRRPLSVGLLGQISTVKTSYIVGYCNQVPILILSPIPMGFIIASNWAYQYRRELSRTKGA